MKINKIELYNIGSYEGLNRFDISKQNKDGKITVIGGKNGAGKTTLFSSIKICLYGYKESGYQAINLWYKNSIKRLINDKAKLQNDAKAYVLLELQIFNGQEWDIYVLKRAWDLDSGSFECFTVEKNNILLSDDEIIDFENYLLNLIPPELFELYFFDGEQIADFFLEDSNGARIRKAFLTICGYDTFDILYKNFKRINKNSSINNDALNLYFFAEDNLNKAEDELRSCNKKIELLSNEIIQIDMELEAKEKKFSSCGGISIDEWNTKLLHIKNEERLREEKNNWLKNAANEIIPFIILRDEIENLVKVMDEEKEIEKVSALYDATNDILPKVLNDSKIPDDLKSYIINKVLDKINIMRADKELILNLSKQDYQSLLLTTSSLLQYESNLVLDAKKEIKKSLKRSQKIRLELEKFDATNFENYFVEKEKLLVRKQEIISEQQILYAEQKELAKNVEKMHAEYKIAEKNLDKKLKNESINDLTTRSILFLDSLQKRLFKSEIQKVQELFMYKMKQLMRKEQFISDIYIDDNFNVHLYKQIKIESKATRDKIKQSSIEDYINEYGEAHVNDLLRVSQCDSLDDFIKKYNGKRKVFNVNIEFNKDTMSKGEKQVFIMALYWAITQLCNKEIPFIIDTPFARIDTEHRSHITEYFFKELKGQVIIFSTNEEITPEHMKVIGDDLQSKFIIENTDNKKTLIIDDKYFGE